MLREPNKSKDFQISNKTNINNRIALILYQHKWRVVVAPRITTLIILIKMRDLNITRASQATAREMLVINNREKILKLKKKMDNMVMKLETVRERNKEI